MEFENKEAKDMTPIEIEETVTRMARWEGLSIEEAKLTYKARQKLPATAFCGPDRSYPANDAAHVRNAFARLSQFGHRLSPAVRSKIHACLARRAKRYGIKHEETVAGKTMDGCKWCRKMEDNDMQETFVKEIRKWYVSEAMPKKK